MGVNTSIHWHERPQKTTATQRLTAKTHGEEDKIQYTNDTMHMYSRTTQQRPNQPPIAARTRSHASCFSALTPSSNVTPCPFVNVILALTRIFPAPPIRRPESCSVCTDVDVGFCEPPRGSMLRISMMESHAAVTMATATARQGQREDVDHISGQ